MSHVMDGAAAHLVGQDRERGSKLRSGVTALAAGGLAGVAGTAVMTLATSLEHPSKVLLTKPEAKPVGSSAPSLPAGQSLDRISRWEYGATWGLVRGALELAGLRGPAAAAALAAAVWGGDQLILPPPGAPNASWTWHRKDMAVDLVRCAVYATATQTTYRWLKGRAHRAG